MSNFFYTGLFLLLISSFLYSCHSGLDPESTSQYIFLSLHFINIVSLPKIAFIKSLTSLIADHIKGLKIKKQLKK